MDKIKTAYIIEWTVYEDNGSYVRWKDYIETYFNDGQFRRRYKELIAKYRDSHINYYSGTVIKGDWIE